MAWTYAQVKAAYSALATVPASLSDAANALNAQMVTLSNQDINTEQAFGILASSATGDWAKLVIRSRQALSGANPPSAADAAVEAAITATSLLTTLEVVSTSISSVATLLQQMLGALETVGDVSSTSVSAILALTTPTVPVWQPALSVGDIQTGLLQP